jgi:signal transduction histidine kinase/CheY-like chemotaxis protein
MSLFIIILALYLDKKFKIMNNNLNYREDLLNSLYSNVDDVFTVFDYNNRRFEYISPNFESMLGINPTELHKNTYVIFDYILPELKVYFNSLFTNAITEFKEIEFEYNHPVLKQHQWLVMRIYPVYKNNQISRYITCILEITKEYQAKVDIREAFLEAQKANEAKKDYLSYMSHELKTPINAILGMTQIAMNSLDDKDKAENCLEKIHLSSKNLLSLIDNVLDTAIIDSGKLLSINEPFHLLKSIAEFSSLMSSQAEIRNIEYRFIYHKMVHDYLVGDNLRIIQILGNCLSNSIKFTPPGGLITLEISEKEHNEKSGLYRFVVTDTGKGMREEYIDRIFEPFEQEDNTIGPNYGGSGLGMSIVKTLIDLMGGIIRVDSTVGVGTTITIDIRLMAVEESIDKPETNNTNTKIPKYDCSGMRVLVVEDNAINLEITIELLTCINIQVDTATNGYDAIKLFEASEEGYYNTILMDIQMPGISGYETSRMMRSSKHPDANKVYIIAMTADNDTNNFSCIQSGMNYHISKPIDIDKFYSILLTIRTINMDYRAM